MRILIVHNTLNDSRSISGVLRHYTWMANEWIKAGHLTDFVAARCGFSQIRALAPQSRLFSSDDFFDASGMDSAVQNQSLHGFARHLATHGVET